MGKRKRERDFLSEYKEAISHMYSWRGLGRTSDYTKRMWETRKPYSRMDGLVYILFGFIFFIISIFIVFTRWEYSNYIFVVVGMISIPMIIWGISKIIRG
jgi:hypothetical protein